MHVICAGRCRHTNLKLKQAKQQPNSNNKIFTSIAYLEAFKRPFSLCAFAFLFLAFLLYICFIFLHSFIRCTFFSPFAHFDGFRFFLLFCPEILTVLELLVFGRMKKNSVRFHRWLFSKRNHQKSFGKRRLFFGASDNVTKHTHVHTNTIY